MELLSTGEKMFSLGPICPLPQKKDVLIPGLQLLLLLSHFSYVQLCATS